jgi:opacity protein-like surface antigen
VYDAYVYSDKVDRSSISVNVGYDFTKSLFTQLGYTYIREEGDIDTLTYHTGFIGLGYRF